jgi:Fe-S-cluster containining protein
MDCLRCGTCCVAPDIAALDKPLGVRCPHLTAELTCGIYQRRPGICRAHRPDEVCLSVSSPTLEERVRRYLALFGLTEEARRVEQARLTSMQSARRP